MKKLAIVYSIFGNLENVSKNIVELSKIFNDYSKNLGNEIVNNAVYSVYNFSKAFNNVFCKITIHKNRIDVLFDNLDDFKALDDNYTKDATKIFCSILNYDKTFQYILNRISVNATYFTEDNDKITLNTLASKLSIKNDSDRISELNLRYNNIVETSFCKVINNISIISYCTLSSGKTFVNKNGIAITKDVNTNPGCFELKDFNKLDNYFLNLTKIADNIPFEI